MQGTALEDGLGICHLRTRVAGDRNLVVAARQVELDASDDAVTLITPDGETRELKDFEICEFGSTAVAVGPAVGAWGELYRPEPKAESTEPAPSEEPSAEAAPEPPKQAEPKPAKKRRSGCLIVLLILMLLGLLLGALAYHYRDRYRDRLPSWTERCREQVPVLVERVKTMIRRTPTEVKVTPPPTIQEIAASHGLRVEDRDGQTFLVGNLKRRTERMAIRAMALASDRTVKFDLTDDQSLKTAVADTLSLVAGGRLTVASVTNRVAKIEGSVTGPAQLANVLKALNQDVPQLVSCETSGVRAAIVAEEAPAKAVAQDGTPAPVAKKAVRVAAKPAAPVAPKMPVAGILTTPYPCVVLTDGSRCLEGSRIGGLVLKRITAEELVFGSGESELKWRP